MGFIDDIPDLQWQFVNKLSGVLRKVGYLGKDEVLNIPQLLKRSDEFISSSCGPIKNRSPIKNAYKDNPSSCGSSGGGGHD